VDAVLVVPSCHVWLAAESAAHLIARSVMLRGVTRSPNVSQKRQKSDVCRYDSAHGGSDG
jgi:hypothetical protein